MFILERIVAMEYNIDHIRILIGQWLGKKQINMFFELRQSGTELPSQPFITCMNFLKSVTLWGFDFSSIIWRP